MWRLRPGQASTKHRHLQQEELYVLLEGQGRIRIEDADPLTLEPHDSLLVGPSIVRQVFNDTDADALWLVIGAPPETANTLEMTAEQLAQLYPDGPRALPPELDVFAHAPAIVARHGADSAALFRTWLPLIGGPARAAVESWRRHEFEGR